MFTDINKNEIDLIIKSCKLCECVFITDTSDNWIIANVEKAQYNNGKLEIILYNVYYNNIKMKYKYIIDYKDIKAIRFSFL